MSQTDLKNPLREAMRNINNFDAPGYSAFREAVKSMQSIDMSAFKLAQEAIRPKELSAFREAVRSIQNIDMSAFNLAQEAIRPKELSAFRHAIKNLKNINLADLSDSSVTSHPIQQHRKVTSNTHREPSNQVTSAKDIGAKIRLSRKAMGMTQKTFADLAGVGRRFVSELEGGKSTLEFDRVLKVCAAAGIDFFAISRGSK